MGEHTDYGLLTLLLQDENGGLQVRTPRGWIEAPPLAGTFVAPAVRARPPLGRPGGLHGHVRRLSAG
ncbi:2OG-Fe(II) oxygenase family protein [Nonomuraea polychroma]|uniref:2OG-Fe(II) oxygenase family protein n=1 Tax=Nonomuraea polychroma TaxID=46176 RepID=UPI003D9202C4